MFFKREHLLKFHLFFCVIITNVLSVNGQFYLGGIQVEEKDISSHYDQMIMAGMNTVEVTHYCRQGVWNTTDLETHNSKALEIDQIRLAKAKGLKVVLVLRTYLKETYSENSFLWHGMIMPSDEESIQTWFNTYQDYVLDWAAIAQSEGVDVLVIGSELNALSATVELDKLPDLMSYYDDDRAHLKSEQRLLKFEHQLEEKHLSHRGIGSYTDVKTYVETKYRTQKKWSEEVSYRTAKNRIDLLNNRRRDLDQHWRTLIQKVRANYKGAISYAANFDNYQDVGFWDVLDIIGINAYFPLREGFKCNNYECIVSECKNAWSKALMSVQNYLDNHNLSQSVMFTELGYTTKKGCTIEPWQSVGVSIVGPWYNQKLIKWSEQPTDYNERVAAVYALKFVVDELHFPLVGILYWKLTSDPRNLSLEPYSLILSNPIQDKLQVALSEFAK